MTCWQTVSNKNYPCGLFINLPILCIIYVFKIQINIKEENLDINLYPTSETIRKKKQRSEILIQLFTNKDVKALKKILEKFTYEEYQEWYKTNAELIITISNVPPLGEIQAMLSNHTKADKFLLIHAALQEIESCIRLEFHLRTSNDFSLKKIGQSKSIKEIFSNVNQLLQNSEDAYGGALNWWAFKKICSAPRFRNKE